MSEVAFQGNPVTVSGVFPEVGVAAAPFKLTTKDLSEYTEMTDSDKVLVINIFPSLDTPVCAESVRTFNRNAASLKDVKVLCVSLDLPFAMGRFCEAEGIENVETLSAFRSPSFGLDFGVEIAAGPLEKLYARAVVVLNKDRQVVYSQLVREITEEPDYDAALAAARL